MKDLEEYIEINLHDFEFDKKFLDLTLKTQATKEKNRQTGLQIF